MVKSLDFDNITIEYIDILQQILPSEDEVILKYFFNFFNQQ